MPRTVKQERCRAGLLALQDFSPCRHDMTGSCLLCAKTKLQRCLQIGFSDDDDGDTAGPVASSQQTQSIGQDNAGLRFPHGWALLEVEELLIPQGSSTVFSGGMRVFGTRSSTHPPPASRARPVARVSHRAFCCSRRSPLLGVIDSCLTDRFPPNACPFGRSSLEGRTIVVLFSLFLISQHTPTPDFHHP